MEIIKGYTPARVRLSRQPDIEFSDLSPRLKSRIREIFGCDMGAAEVVDRIIFEVRSRGDTALREYMHIIDGVRLEQFEVDRDRVNEAYRLIDPGLVSAMNLAAERIREFHQAQKDAVWHGISGKEWSQLIRPLQRVGLYAPGGTAPLASSILMTAIPPRIAGVSEIILTTPPQINGQISAVSLVAADIAGVNRIFALGGAQAIAAMAYGTESVPRVDKICGPGNLFVALAKKAVFGNVGIDALQGPSEVCIIADSSADAEYCAADLLSQAEHDSQSQVVFITTSSALAQDVQKELQKQISDLPRRLIAAESLEKRGLIIVVDNLDEAIELANLYAPEHLELAIGSADRYIEKITGAGCIFLGENSTEPLGDYVAGPNHSLPTGGTARFSSPLNILDFIKITNVVKISSENLEKLGKAAVTLARAEGLEAHARAVEKRLRGKI